MHHVMNDTVHPGMLLHWLVLGIGAGYVAAGDIRPAGAAISRWDVSRKYRHSPTHLCSSIRRADSIAAVHEGMNRAFGSHIISFIHL